MIVFPNADSLWVRLPYLETSIPAASLWGAIGALLASVVTLVGTLTIAYVVYRLGRTQFRSNRWWQLQEERYTAIVNELGTIRDAAAKLARYDEPDVEPEDVTVTYTPEETAEFQNQIRQALDVLRREIHRGVLLLSPRAIEAVRGYIWKAEQPVSMDVEHPRAQASGLAGRAYSEFADIAQRDLGVPGLWLARRKAGYAALRDRLDRLWYPPWSPETQKKVVDLVVWRRELRERQGGRLAPRGGQPPQPLAKRIMRWIKQNFFTIQN